MNLIKKTLLLILVTTIPFLSNAAFAARQWTSDIKVVRVGLATTEYASNRECLFFTDQNKVPYYYDHNNEPLRLERAKMMLSVLLFAKATGNTIKLVTDDAPEGACGDRVIRHLSAE